MAAPGFVAKLQQREKPAGVVAPEGLGHPEPHIA
jgi:hypothetical protein